MVYDIPLVVRVYTNKHHSYDYKMVSERAIERKAKKLRAEKERIRIGTELDENYKLKFKIIRIPDGKDKKQIDRE